MAMATACFMTVAGMFGAADGYYLLGGTALAATLCILASGSIAEIASRFPAAPGITTYLKVAFGESISLPMVFTYLTLVVSLAGVESYLFAAMVEEFLPGIASPFVLAIGMLVFVIITNLSGLEMSRRLQTFTTIALALGTGALSLSLIMMAPAELPPPGPDQARLEGLLPFATASAMAVFLFIGFEWVTPLGRNPEAYRTLIPLSMPIGIAILALMYGFFAYALWLHLPGETIFSTALPHFLAGHIVSSEYGRYAAAAISLLTMMTSFNAGLMGASRLMYAMARQKNLPSMFASMSDRGVPVNVVLLIGGIAVVAAALVIHYRAHLLAAVVGAAIECFLYGILVLAAIRLRRSSPDVPPTFRNPVPEGVEWALVVIMPLFGVAALLSIPDSEFLPSIVLVVVTVVMLLISKIILRWKDNSRKAAHATAATSPAVRR
jgi:amino acid transporter